MNGFAQQLRDEFDLPVPVAVWVVVTHIFVLACPLTLIWAVDVYGAQLGLANPTLLKIASAIYIAAIAFEVAQNSADRWYLTEATRSVADLFFNFFLTFSFCLYTAGFYSNTWMTIAAALLTVIYPFAYIQNHPAHRGISGTVVLLATVSLYLAIGDPAVFLFLTGNAIAVYFITFLIKRHAQWLHGWGAFLFGLAFLAWPWAMMNAANGTPRNWLFVGAMTVATAVFGAALTPLVSRAKPTPRQQLRP